MSSAIPRSNKLQVTFWTEPRLDAIWMGVVSFLFALLLISQVVGPLKGLTGDEPHYLMVAHSIVSDGDLDLRDDYVEEQAWSDFYSGPALPPHYAPGLGGHYSTRMIGLGVYLAPFYWLGTLVGDVVFFARLSMAILYTLLVVNIYLLCRDLALSRDVSAAAWLFGAFSVPLAFYSYSIYPEVGAALLLILALRLMFNWDGSGIRAPLLAGVCLAAMPWLGIKYTAIALVAAVAFTVKIIRREQRSIRRLAALFAAPVLAIALLALFLLTLYGSLSPTVIYTGVGEDAKPLASVNLQAIRGADGFLPPVGDYVRVALMYFFDQRDGILFYSPVYLFGIAGLLLMLYRKHPLALTMASIFLVHWIAYSLSGWSSGHAPAGRPLVAVIWVLVVGMAVAYDKVRGNLANGIRIVVSTITLVFFALIVTHNHIIYHVLLGHTEKHGNNFFASIPAPFDLTALFPNLFNPNDIHPLPTILFIALAVTIVLVIFRLGSREQRGGPSTPGPWLVAFCGGFPLLILGVSYLGAELIADEDLLGGGNIRIAFNDGNTYGLEPVDADRQIGFWVKGGGKANVSIVCAESPSTLLIDVHSRVVQTVELEVEGAAFKLNFDRPRWRRLEVPGKLAVPWRHRSLFRIAIASPSGFHPVEAGEKTGQADTRNLGCRVGISSQE